VSTVARAPAFSSLLSAELRRIASRRLHRLVLLLTLVAIAVAAVIVFARSHHGPPSDVGFADPRFHLTALTGIFKGTTVPLVLLAWLMAASFVGAEWHTGSMTTWLTWEPRRVQVLAAKALVVIAGTFLATILLQTVLGLALLPAAALRGTTAGSHGAWFHEVIGVLLRAATLTSIAAAFGFAIATVARSTAAALGVGFGYLLVIENFIAVLRPGWRSWMFAPNAIVFVNGHGGFLLPPRSATEAGLLLGIYALLALAVATVWFARRDVT
jgi:hypothetical protein